MKTTTIQVGVATRDELRSRGRMGETYDEVIRRLLAATRNRDGSSSGDSRRSYGSAANPLFARQDRG